MKLRGRLTLALLIALCAAGLLLATRWWPSIDPNTGAAVPSGSDSTSVGNRASAFSEPGSRERSGRNPNVPDTPKSAASPTDTLLQQLRAKLQAANVVPNEALLTFRSAAARERFAQEAAAHGLEVVGEIPQLNSARVRYGRLEDLHDSIAADDAELAGVEGNLWMRIPGTSAPQRDPNNEGGRAPFGYNLMSAINAAGDRTHWGERVTVAVLDTGILAHRTFAEGQIMHLDLVNDGQSFHSHGTSVASLIGGQHPQAPGVAPAAQILDVRVANAEGYSTSSTLAQGIITAVDRGARVINISLGGYGDSSVLGQAVAYAFQRGAIVVAAAGNDAYGQLAIPAAYEGVISVGSVDAENRQAYFL